MFYIVRHEFSYFIEGSNKIRGKMFNKGGEKQESRF